VFIKKAVRYVGGYALARRLNRGLVTIMMYHGVGPTMCHPLSQRKLLPLDVFEQQLRFYKQYCTPVSLDMVLASRELPPNPIVLTFDDGYKNNYDHVFPLLVEYNIPATIFVTTGFIDRKTFLWTDYLEYLVYFANGREQRPAFRQFINAELNLQVGADATRVTVDTIKRRLKTVPDAAKTTFLSKMASVLDVEYDWQTIPLELQPLSWEEIREMQNSGFVSIGSHTVTHPILSKCDCEKQKHELQSSKQRISQELRTRCDQFAYPNGQRSDYNCETLRLLRELGYRAALTSIPGYVLATSSDELQLPRFGTTELAALRPIVTGVTRWLHKL